MIMAKSIFTAEFNGQRIFIACRICKGLLELEKRIGSTIDPTGLTSDYIGAGLIEKYGQIYNLKEFKSLLKRFGL